MKKKVLSGMLVLGLLTFLTYVFLVTATDFFINSVGSYYVDDVVWETTLNGTVASDKFGYSVASGDVNNDSYADIIVGAYQADTPGAGGNDDGQAFVFFGTANGIADMDVIYANITLNGTATNNYFGSSVASGDVNNDSYADVIVGAYKASPSGAGDAGQAFVFFGADYASTVNENAGSYANITLNGTAANDQFGYSVASGDINNDSYADIIVGANLASPLGEELPQSGQAYVFFGADYASTVNENAGSYANITLNGTVTEDYFGYSVGTGDVNNDSYADIIVGANAADPPGQTNAGQAYVFFGADYTTAVNKDAPTYANITFNGTAANDEFGYSVASGDINNDSYADIIVGAYQADTPGAGGNDDGQAFVFFGADYASTVNEDASTYANITLNGTVAGDKFGVSVGTGDVNNDNYTDVLIGAYTADPRNATEAVTDAGQVYLFFGADYASTVNEDALSSANITLNGTVTGDSFGWSVSSGDVNNDSYADIIVGAYQADPSSGTNAGQVYIYAYDVTNPVVRLDGPSSGSTDGDGEVNFSFTATDVHPDMCSVYINSTLSDWAMNTSVSYSSNIQGSIAVNLTDATYTWNIECNDTGGNSAFNDTNYTVTVSNDAPAVTLDAPSDNSYDTDGDANFSFTTIETYPDKCTLWFRSNATNWAANDSASYSNNTQVNIFVNLTDAVYVWNVECNDTVNNPAFASANRTLTVDRIAPVTPTVTEPSDTSINPRDSISYTCESSDATAGINSWAWTLTKPPDGGTVTKTGSAVTSDTQSFSGDETNLAGTYTVSCEAEDKAGFKSSSSKTFAVYYSHHVEAPSEGSSAAAELDLSTQEELTITEKQGVITTFTLDGTTVHSIKIKTVDEAAGTVTIIIESDPITITLKIGETEEVDVDADRTNDISVTLNNIKEGVADITTKRLTPLPEKEVPTEEVPPTEKPAEEITPTVEAASKAWQWILVTVILVVIGVGYWFMKKKK